MQDVCVASRPFIGLFRQRLLVIVPVQGGIPEPRPIFYGREKLPPLIVLTSFTRGFRARHGAWGSRGLLRRANAIPNKMLSNTGRMTLLKYQQRTSQVLRDDGLGMAGLPGPFG